MSSTTLKVPNISCHHCVMTIQREVGVLEGVEGVEGDVEAKIISLVYRDDEVLEKVKATLAEIGYPVAE